MASVVTIMKLSGSYNDFKVNLDRIHPRFGENFEMDLQFPELDEEEGDG